MSTLPSFLLSSSVLLLLCASAAAQRQRISVPVTPEGDVRRFDVTPDGRTAVYSVRESAGAPFRLYSIGLPDGATKLLDADSSEGFLITDDGRRVVFARHFEICSVPIDGSEDATRVLMNGQGLYFSVIYQATQDDADAFEPWAVPLFGGPQRKLSRPGEEAYSFDVSPDSRQVAYIADVGVDGHQLFLTALEPGSTVVQLSEAAETPFVWGLPERGAFTADGQWSRTRHACSKGVSSTCTCTP